MVRSILLAAAILVAAPAAAADKMTIILDWFVNPNHGPIIIAREKGFFEAEGLDVTVIAPADPAHPPKLVAAGKADLAISYQPQLHLQIHEGLPLIRVGTLVASPLNCLLVLKGGPINRIADLKGRKIGYSVAGVEQAVVTAILRKAGLKPTDVEMVNVNWSLSPALMARKVDAVIGAYRNFELTQMEINKVPGRCFFVEEVGLPAYDELIYVANHKTMDKGKIARFLRATELATQWIINHPEASWKIFSATAKELQDELNRRAWKDTLPRFALRPAAFDAGRYRALEAFLRSSGLVPSETPVGRLTVDVTAD